EHLRAAVRSAQRVLLGGSADEGALIEPLSLDELELTPDVRADKKEIEAPVNAVILQHAFRERRAINPATADHAVKVDFADFLGVAEVHPPNVGAARRLQTGRVVRVKKKVVVALRVGAQRGIIVHWTPRQGSATAPASDDFRGEQFLVLRVGSEGA